ncbi:MAG TPA: isocitrate lyase/phosphoenolpyruvate mutase family protein [Streptosporangiaceae bacterium]|nr:isocitrate lyase/phosphoenolpyruvate mutase family protein [Streptosporangiaceae bacterium]
MTMIQKDKAELFRSLHTGGTVLRLANVWDVASALLIEEAGATAIATTSAGVAWSLGAPDGDRLDRDRAIDLVARVAAAVELPVSADIESGFADDPDGVADTITGVVAAGAVGVNLEDSVQDGAEPLRPVGEQCERLAAARRAADATGIPLYINARIDTFLLHVGERATRLPDALARAEAYVAAGADGIFVPGVIDPATISELVKGVPAPLNILVGHGAPAIDELAGLGVARVSVGSAIASTAYAVTRRAAQEVLAGGTYESLADRIPHGELNALFRARRSPAASGPA